MTYQDMKYISCLSIYNYMIYPDTKRYLVYLSMYNITQDSAVAFDSTTSNSQIKYQVGRA